MLKTFIIRRVLLLFILPLFMLINCRGQDLLFPSYGSYEIVKDYPVYNSGDLWDYINGAAESYIALGFEELYIAEYKKGRKISIKAEIYKHNSANMAFGIYSLERSSTYNFIDIGAEGYRDIDHVHFLKDKFYIKVSTHSKSKKSITAVYDIARNIANSIDGTNSKPDALKLFPESGRLPYEDFYISESILGHEFLTKAFKANYRVKDKSFGIYLFNEAREAENQEMVERYLKRQGLEPGDSPDGKFMFEDGYNGTIFFAWKTNITILLTGLSVDDASIANDYINEILK